MLSFKKDVYIVQGIKRACIYDLNQGILYHLNDKELQFMNNIRGKNKEELFLNARNKERLNFLIKNNIIEESPEFRSGDISILAIKPQIDFAWIEVTEQCNLKCIHCYDESCIQNSSRMTLENFKYVIDELISMNIKKVQLIGGEPLILGQQLKEMVEYCYGRMTFTEVFTNATFLTKELCQFFALKKVHVAVSVYSYEEQMHDKVTQTNGSYEQTIKGIELLKEYGVKYRVANVLIKDIKLGTQNTDLFRLSQNRDVVRLTGRAKLDLLDVELIKKRLITKERFTIPLNKDFVSRMVYGHNCFSRRLYISSNLDVYPCVMERRIHHGNMKGGSLQNIIKDKILQFNKDNIEVCNKCEFRYCCHDCRPDSLDGNIDAKPWMCTYNPAEGEWENPENYAMKILESNT